MGAEADIAPEDTDGMVTGEGEGVDSVTTPDAGGAGEAPPTE